MSRRTKLLLQSHNQHQHTKHRTVKPLTIWSHNADPTEPIVIRKAKALKLLLDETPATVMDNELIIGLRSIYKELGEDENYVDGVYGLPVKPATMHNRRFYPHYLTAEEAAEALQAGVHEGEYTSHVPFGTQKVLTLGLTGLMEEAEAKLSSLCDSEKPKRDFLKAVLIVLKASSDFIAKHADECLKQAESTDDERRRELQELAETCKWIAVNPPRGFHEALQLFWFCTLVMAAENQSCIPIGRFDQDLHPYLERDLAEGALTLEEAQELVECLWIKLNFESDLTTDTCRNVTLAGQTRDGGDATNPLTYLCLDAALALRLPDPKLNVRFHAGSPVPLWEKCVKMVKAGLGGFPSFYNDEAILRGLTRMGVPMEEARLFSCDGCQEIILPGRGDFYPVHTGVDLLACVQRTLGVQPYLYEVGEKPQPSANHEYGSFTEFMDGYMHVLDEMILEAVEEGNRVDTGLARFSPVPFLSCTLEGCIENAMDKTEGGCTYNWTGCNGQAFATAVNALAAVKQIVYDEKLLTPSALRAQLEEDWPDERLRQYALNRVPKWGNDDDYVDSIAVKVAGHFIEEVLTHSNPRGGPFYPGIFTFHHVLRGMGSPASPDGRHAGDPLSQHLSPHAGTDRMGPTLSANSVLKVTELIPPEGSALDIRFHPTALAGAEGEAKLMSFIKGWMRRGGLVVQFNVVDSETLKRAQVNPEQYASLLVRVWGFSAYFTTLTREYQDEIIARTVHGFE